MPENKSPLIRLKNLLLEKVQETIIETGEPAFRAKQVIKWVYQKRVDSFDAMNNISKVTRQKLANSFTIEKLKIETINESQNNDAVKFGFQLRDSLYMVESVLLIDSDRRTACLSSQLGCGLGCTFCETGRLGLIRNLTQEEIVGQIIGINDYLAAIKTN